MCPLAWPKEFLDSVDHVANNIVQNMLLSETELECEWPTTVCVGDLQPFNILRRTDVSSELVFIDFQLCLLGEGHTDIGYFLAWVLSPKDRKQHEERILREHYDTMVAAGMDDSVYPFSLYFLRYKISTVFALMRIIVSAAGIRRDEDRYIVPLIKESLCAFLKDHGDPFENWKESVKIRLDLMSKKK